MSANNNLHRTSEESKAQEENEEEEEETSYYDDDSSSEEDDHVDDDEIPELIYDTANETDEDTKKDEIRVYALPSTMPLQLRWGNVYEEEDENEDEIGSVTSLSDTTGRPDRIFRNPYDDRALIQYLRDYYLDNPELIHHRLEQELNSHDDEEAKDDSDE